LLSESLAQRARFLMLRLAAEDVVENGNGAIEMALGRVDFRERHGREGRGRGRP
jgi:hypothetical protein